MKKGQTVKIKTAIVNGNTTLVPKDYKQKHEVKSFTIISTPNKYNEFYSIQIDDSILGWYINIFHVSYLNVDKKYLGKKFFDVNENYFV